MIRNRISSVGPAEFGGGVLQFEAPHFNMRPVSTFSILHKVKRSSNAAHPEDALDADATEHFDNENPYVGNTRRDSTCIIESRPANVAKLKPTGVAKLKQQINPTQPLNGTNGPINGSGFYSEHRDIPSEMNSATDTLKHSTGPVSGNGLVSGSGPLNTGPMNRQRKSDARVSAAMLANILEKTDVQKQKKSELRSDLINRNDDAKSVKSLKSPTPMESPVATIGSGLTIPPRKSVLDMRPGKGPVDLPIRVQPGGYSNREYTSINSLLQQANSTIPPANANVPGERNPRDTNRESLIAGGQPTLQTSLGQQFLLARNQNPASNNPAPNNVLNRFSGMPKASFKFTAPNRFQPETRSIEESANGLRKVQAAVSLTAQTVVVATALPPSTAVAPTAQESAAPKLQERVPSKAELQSMKIPSVSDASVATLIPTSQPAGSRRTTPQDETTNGESKPANSTTGKEMRQAPGAFGAINCTGVAGATVGNGTTAEQLMASINDELRDFKILDKASSSAASTEGKALAAATGIQSMPSQAKTWPSGKPPVPSPTTQGVATQQHGLKQWYAQPLNMKVPYAIKPGVSPSNSASIMEGSIQELSGSSIEVLKIPKIIGEPNLANANPPNSPREKPTAGSSVKGEQGAIEGEQQRLAEGAGRAEDAGRAGIVEEPRKQGSKPLQSAEAVLLRNAKKRRQIQTALDDAKKTKLTKDEAIDRSQVYLNYLEQQIRQTMRENPSCAGDTSPPGRRTRTQIGGANLSHYLREDISQSPVAKQMKNTRARTPSLDRGYREDRNASRASEKLQGLQQSRELAVAEMTRLQDEQSAAKQNYDDLVKKMRLFRTSADKALSALRDKRGYRKMYSNAATYGFDANPYPAVFGPGGVLGPSGSVPPEGGDQQPYSTYFQENFSLNDPRYERHTAASVGAPEFDATSASPSIEELICEKVRNSSIATTMQDTSTQNSKVPMAFRMTRKPENTRNNSRKDLTLPLMPRVASSGMLPYPGGTSNPVASKLDRLLSNTNAQKRRSPPPAVPFKSSKTGSKDKPSVAPAESASSTESTGHFEGQRGDAGAVERRPRDASEKRHTNTVPDKRQAPDKRQTNITPARDPSSSTPLEVRPSPFLSAGKGETSVVRNYKSDSSASPGFRTSPKKNFRTSAGGVSQKSSSVNIREAVARLKEDLKSSGSSNQLLADACSKKSIKDSHGESQERMGRLLCGANGSPGKRPGSRTRNDSHNRMSRLEMALATAEEKLRDLV